MDWMSADSGGGCQRFFFVEAIPRFVPYSYIYIHIYIVSIYLQFLHQCHGRAYSFKTPFNGVEGSVQRFSRFSGKMLDAGKPSSSSFTSV